MVNFLIDINTFWHLSLSDCIYLWGYFFFLSFSLFSLHCFKEKTQKSHHPYTRESIKSQMDMLCWFYEWLFSGSSDPNFPSYTMSE